MNIDIDLKTNTCVVERDLSSWGVNDFYDFCRGIHHYVPWTLGEHIAYSILTAIAGVALLAISATVFAAARGDL